MVEGIEKRINPSEENNGEQKQINKQKKQPTITAGNITIPHIGKKKTTPLDLFGTGPFRGGSSGKTGKK